MDNYVIHTLHSKQSRNANTSTYIFICTSVSTLISIYNIINSERTKEYSRFTNIVSFNQVDLFSIKAPGDIWIRVSCTKTSESNRVCFKYILISGGYKNNRRTCENRLRNRKIIEVLQKILIILKQFKMKEYCMQGYEKAQKQDWDGTLTTKLIN